MSVDWGYYNKFDGINEKYLPVSGEGETKATQIVTAVNKLVYKWYNDGDVFDNTHYLDGWCNDLSSYANWLYKHCSNRCMYVLLRIEECLTNNHYEKLLKDLADNLLEENYLLEQSKFEKVDTIYDCNGKFKFIESYDDEDDYYDEDEDDNDSYY